MKRHGRMAGCRAGKLMALAALAGSCVVASMPAMAGVSTDTVTATNWVRQTTSAGTNYFLGRMGIATSTPSATLHVAGSVRVDGAMTNNGNWSAASGTTQNLATVYASRYFNTNNTTSGTASAALGGSGNIATGDYSVVGGGLSSRAAGTNSAVAGGRWNLADGVESFVGGGRTNQASGKNAAVCGGEANAGYGLSSFIGGGYGNQAWYFATAIAGGDGNQTWENWAAIGGGWGNEASNAYSTVSGGETNSATGLNSVVPGGGNNIAQGQYSLAAGRGAGALHDGALVWADNHNTSFNSTATNQFLIRASGGVGIGTNSPLAMLHVGGTARFDAGITYVPPMGNLSMGSYTNLP